MSKDTIWLITLTDGTQEWADGPEGAMHDRVESITGYVKLSIMDKELARVHKEYHDGTNT